MLQSSYAEKAPHSQGIVHRVFSGKTGLADMLTFCQGNCSPRQTKEVKVLYRRYKEGAYSVVEFLRGAGTVMGNEPLLHSMLAQRSSCSEVSCTSDFTPINLVKDSDKKGPCGYSVRAQHTLGRKRWQKLVGDSGKRTVL